MEQKLYLYYSTQRPIDIGTYPNSADNTPLKIVNYGEGDRIAVENGTFYAWGELLYVKSLTETEQYQYELRPCANNPDVQEQMHQQAQTVGPWEVYRRVPEEKRVTAFDINRAVFVPRTDVTPLRMNAQHNSAQKFPVQKNAPANSINVPSMGSDKEEKRMYPLNAATERFEAVEIFGIPGLFATERVNRETVPPGMYAYDMQTSAEDWSQPALLARWIMVEHYGTVLTASPIPLPTGGYLDLKPGDFAQSTPCEGLTTAEFETKYLAPASAAPRRHRPRTHSAPAR